MPEFNPLAARQAGYQYVGNILDDRARQRAGSQYMADPAAAAATLAEAGMIEDASALQARQAATAAAERARLQQDEEDDNTWLARGATSLLQVPAAQRRSVYQSQIRPGLESRLDADQLAQADASDLSDAELRAILTYAGGTAPSLTAGDRAGANGAVLRADPYTGAYTPVYTPVFDAREGASPGYVWTDESRTAQRFIPGGQADPAVVGVIDAARRDPPRARASGGGRSGGSRSSGGGSRPSGGVASGGSSLPPGFTVRR